MRKIIFKGEEIAKNGTNGIDGDSTIGTVIAYMGTTAPRGYLACDGSVYNISEYIELANHFYREFGQTNFFGGNGTTTFAVPDLRGEFIRGAGTATRDTGTGADVGVHQDGTSFPNIYANTNNAIASFGNSGENVNASNTDKQFTSNTKTRYSSLTVTDTTVNAPVKYTSRPTNTAVLYCIRSQKDNPRDQYIFQPHVYSEQEVPIGIGMSGETIYRKCFYRTGLIYGKNNENIDTFNIGVSGLDKITCLKGVFYGSFFQFQIPIMTYDHTNGAILQIYLYFNGSNIIINASNSGFDANNSENGDMLVIAEYNKVQS